MEKKDVKLIQMDLIFDVKLNVKKKLRPVTLSKQVRKIAIEELTDEIRKIKNELRRANKRYRQGKISKNELFDTEWYLYELQQELEILKGQQPESSDSKTDI